MFQRFKALFLKGYICSYPKSFKRLQREIRDEDIENLLDRFKEDQSLEVKFLEDNVIKSMVRELEDIHKLGKTSKHEVNIEELNKFIQENEKELTLKLCKYFSGEYLKMSDIVVWKEVISLPFEIKFRNNLSLNIEKKYLIQSLYFIDQLLEYGLKDSFFIDIDQTEASIKAIYKQLVEYDGCKPELGTFKDLECYVNLFDYLGMRYID